MLAQNLNGCQPLVRAPIGRKGALPSWGLPSADPLFTKGQKCNKAAGTADVSACPGLIGGVRVPGRMGVSRQSPFHVLSKGEAAPFHPAVARPGNGVRPCPLPFVLGAVTGPPWHWI